MGYLSKRSEWCQFQSGDREELLGALPNERLIQAEERGKKEVTLAVRKLCDCIAFLKGMAGFYQADSLTHANQVILDQWFQVPFLGEPKCN